MSEGDRVDQFVATLTDDDVTDLMHHWPLWARPQQMPPTGDWTTWLLMGGRGSGKTRAGAEWVQSIAAPPEGAPTSPIALVGETLAEARAVMVEGPSGILSIAPSGKRPRFDAGRGQLTWPNGAIARLMSASDPDSFRGPQFAAAWSDEIAKWPHAESAWDMLQFGLRLGERPRQLATTTPRPTILLKRLMSDENCVLVRMKTEDNRNNLAPAFLTHIVGAYAGTALGRQELDGELIEDREGALWTYALIDRARAKAPQPLGRIVVAVDPSVSGKGTGDACGIIIAGASADGATVMRDCTLPSTRPLVWAEKALSVYHEHGADCLIVESNQGGDLVRDLMAQIDPSVPVKNVRATRGKWLRAEPVATLYERGLIRHESGLSDLENELVAFDQNGRADGKSPDRVDALVWAITELMLSRVGTPKVRTI